MSTTLTDLKQELENLRQKRASKNKEIDTLSDIQLFSKHYFDVKLFKHQIEWDTYSEYLRMLLLAPRGHGKTYFWLFIKPMYELLKNQNKRILLISKKEKNAQKSLRVLKRQFEANPQIKEKFGDLRGEPWGQNAFFLNRPDDRLKDPSIEATCVLGGITGGRFDIVIMDDLLDVENTWTEGRREKIKEWIDSEVLNVLERDGKAWMIGTRKHHADYYQSAIDKQSWVSIVQKAIIQWPQSYSLVLDERNLPVGVDVEGNYEIFAPDMWKIDQLLMRRYDNGEIFFEREFQNNATVTQGKCLKKEWLRFYSFTVHDPEYDLLKITPLGDLRIVQAWDLAIGEKMENDYTVCSTWGKNKHGTCYLLDIYRAKIPFPTQVKEVANQALTCLRRYGKRPQKILIESVAYQRALAQMALREAQKQGLNLPIVELQTKGSKMERFQSMAPFFENGTARIRNGQDMFIKEWLDFPDGETDDVLDSAEMGLQDLLQYRTKEGKGLIWL